MGFEGAVTIAGGRVHPGDDPYTLKRIRMNEGITIEEFANLVA
jgi:hypothetical protein